MPLKPRIVWMNMSRFTTVTRIKVKSGFSIVSNVFIVKRIKHLKLIKILRHTLKSSIQSNVNFVRLTISKPELIWKSISRIITVLNVLFVIATQFLKTLTFSELTRL
jgi:hypothetical protein